MPAQHLYVRDQSALVWREMNPLDSSGKGIMVYKGGAWNKVKRVYYYKTGTGWALAWERYFAPAPITSLVFTVTFDPGDDVFPGTLVASWGGTSGPYDTVNWRTYKRQNSGLWSLFASGNTSSGGISLTGVVRYGTSGATTTGFKIETERVNTQSGEIGSTAIATTADKAFTLAFP